MDKQTIYVVIAGPLLLAAYTREDSAHLHARCITDGKAVACELTGEVHGRPAALSVVHVVISGAFVFGAYTNGEHAERHAKSVDADAKAVACELLEQVSEGVRDDLFEDWDEEAQTPVDDKPPDHKM